MFIHVPYKLQNGLLVPGLAGLGPVLRCFIWEVETLKVSGKVSESLRLWYSFPFFWPLKLF